MRMENELLKPPLSQIRPRAPAARRRMLPRLPLGSCSRGKVATGLGRLRTCRYRPSGATTADPRHHDADPLI